MANWKQMIGQQYGNWLILERDYNPTSKQHSTFFKAKCLLCSQIYSVSRDSIVNGKSSCCNHCKKPEGTEHIEVGTRFGMLVTLDRPHKKEDRHETHKFITCKCDCGNIIEVDVRHLKGYDRGNGKWGATRSCGCSNRSLGEQKIKEIFDEYKCNYKEQYIISDFNPFARFDFALFDNNQNLVKLIEYDGQQHFKAIDYFGGEKQFQIQKQRDKAKDDYCRENGLVLQRIPYTDLKMISPEYLGIDRSLIPE